MGLYHAAGGGLITSIALGLNLTNGPQMPSFHRHQPLLTSPFHHAPPPPAASPHLFLSHLPPHPHALVSRRATTPLRALLRRSPSRRGPGHAHGCKLRTVGTQHSITSEAPDDERGAARRGSGDTPSLNRGSCNYVLRQDQSNKTIFIEQLYSVIHLRV